MALETSAGIIIYRKTIDGPRFLILYHGRGYWNFPKGKIESEERTFQTALREIREETGINRNELKFQDNFKVFEKFTFWRKEEKIYKTITFYLAETERKAIKISEEKEGQPHEGFAWFTYKEAVKVLSKHKDSLRVLKQASDFISGRKPISHQNTRHPVKRNNYQGQNINNRSNSKFGSDQGLKANSNQYQKRSFGPKNNYGVQRKGFQGGQKNPQRGGSNV